MSTSYPDKPRQPMPRCIDYATAAAIGLLRTFRQHQANLEKPSFDVIVDWQNNPTIFTAVDLVSEAIIVKDFSSEHAVSAAHFILDKAPAISKFVREIALIFLGYATQVELAHDRPSPELYQRKISKLKEMVRSYPSNPIAWSELSLCYAVLGQTDKSRAAMQVALQIGGGESLHTQVSGSLLRTSARTRQIGVDSEQVRVL